jgi:DNA-binding protein YbaB
MMKQAMELKSKLDKAKKELSKMTAEAEAGKGAVKVVASGDQKIISIKIAPEAVNPAKTGDLEKLFSRPPTTPWKRRARWPPKR